MNIKAIILIITCFLASPKKHVSEADEVLDKVIDVYEKSPSYKLSMTYNIYDSGTKTAKETTKSTYYKNGNKHYLKMSDSEMIWMDNLFIKVSHSEKIIAISSMSSAVTSNQHAITKERFRDFTKKNLKDYKTFWRCTMYPAEGSESAIYKYVTIDIAKKDYRILNQQCYFGVSLEKMYRNKETNVTERMEILIDDFQSKISIPKELFATDTYFKKEGKKLIASGKHKGYKVMDSN